MGGVENGKGGAPAPQMKQHSGEASGGTFGSFGHSGGSASAPPQPQTASFGTGHPGRRPAPQPKPTFPTGSGSPGQIRSEGSAARTPRQPTAQPKSQVPAQVQARADRGSLDRGAEDVRRIQARRQQAAAAQAKPVQTPSAPKQPKPEPTRFQHPGRKASPGKQSIGTQPIGKQPIGQHPVRKQPAAQQPVPRNALPNQALPNQAHPNQEAPQPGQPRHHHPGASGRAEVPQRPKPEAKPVEQSKPGTQKPRWNDAQYGELKREAIGLTKTSDYQDYLEGVLRPALERYGASAAAEFREIVEIHKGLLPPHEKADGDRLSYQAEAMIRDVMGPEAAHAPGTNSPFEARLEEETATEEPAPQTRDWTGVDKFPQGHDGPMRSAEEEFNSPQRSKEYLEFRDAFLQDLNKNPGGAGAWFAARREAFGAFNEQSSKLLNLAVQHEKADEGSAERERLAQEMKDTAVLVTEAFGQMQAFALPPELAGDMDFAGATAKVEKGSVLETAIDLGVTAAALFPPTAIPSWAVRTGAAIYGLSKADYDAETRALAYYDRNLTQNLVEAQVDLSDPNAVREFAENSTEQTREEFANAMFTGYADMAFGQLFGKMSAGTSAAISRAFKFGKVPEAGIDKIFGEYGGELKGQLLSDK